MAATRKYPVELRERAVRLYRESDPKPVIAQLARQLNVHPEGAVNLAGAQRDRGVQGLGGLGVGGMGQAAAVSPVTSLQTANRRVISVR